MHCFNRHGAMNNQNFSPKFTFELISVCVSLLNPAIRCCMVCLLSVMFCVKMRV